MTVQRDVLVVVDDVFLQFICANAGASTCVCERVYVREFIWSVRACMFFYIATYLGNCS